MAGDGGNDAGRPLRPAPGLPSGNGMDVAMCAVGTRGHPARHNLTRTTMTTAEIAARPARTRP